jgi:hypothetical protein
MEDVSFKLTWQIPRIKLVDVQLPDELNGDRLLLDLLLEVETNQLFIGWMESEPGKEDLI